MVTVWWSASGIMHYNFLDPGETISAEKVYQEIDKMHQELRRLRPALINRKDQFFFMTMPDHISHKCLCRN
uniref:Inner membrane protein n=1 Tax=Heterorhabditis bacteriophora TaxID=37862 RepID=A0A1I7WJD9_HETBA